MNTKRIAKFSDYVSYVENNTARGELVLFRGQPIEGQLLPKIARQDPKRNTTDMEKQTLAELRRLGASFIGDTNIDNWELLVKA